MSYNIIYFCGAESRRTGRDMEKNEYLEFPYDKRHQEIVKKL
jgi:hypothetical protein